MAPYRVYIINGEDRILIGSSARCASDDEACQAARRMLRNDARAEVWLGSRLVRQLPAQAHAADGD